MTNIIKRWYNKLFGKADVHIPHSTEDERLWAALFKPRHRRRRDHMARRIFRGVAVPRAGAIWE